MNPAQMAEALAKLQALKTDLETKPKAVPQLIPPETAKTNQPNQPTTKAADSLANLRAIMAAKLKPKSESVGEARSTPANTYTSELDSPKQISQGIQYNEKQSEFISIASSQSCVLIGAAGTGKTTATGGLIKSLSLDLSFPPLDSTGHKHLTNGTPGIVCCAFTRRATNNIRRVMPENMKGNCLTLHKLLEFMPEYYEDFDAEGKAKTKMRFVPNRHRGNPLPATLHTIIIEEASMVGTDLHDLLLDAIRHPVKLIYLGDIQQLPPVFGPAILGFKLLELPVIELTEVYRQALDSPIIRLAHTILRGEPLTLDKTTGANQPHNVPGKLTLHAWKKSLTEDGCNLVSASFFKQAYATGAYDPENDIILIPFNKSFGTIELNKHLATFLTRARDAEVYEIIAGFQKKYFAVGDKVMYEKEDAKIIRIARNLRYVGKPPAKPSKQMDYWGHGADGDSKTLTHEEIDRMLEQASVDERQNQASHVITLYCEDREEEVSIETAGEINALDLGYAITVHKAQGSEWRRVFFLSSKLHNVMLNREMVYTAVTRAREHLYVICDHELFQRTVTQQKIKGNSLAEKAIYFQGRFIEQK